MPLARVCLRLAAALAPRQLLVLVSVVAILIGAVGPASADPSGPQASTHAVVPATPRVHAVYHITWNGLSLGDFTWDSDIKAGQYKAATSASVSALFGAYTWEGATRASGVYVTGQPHPAAYKFHFKATDKSGRVDMAFANDKIINISQDPPEKVSSERIPLKPAHLENVLDPLSAIVAMTSPGSGTVDTVNPCQRHLQVFDGQQRFDLILSFKRKTRVDNATGAKTAFVCAIRYVPIAGMKMNTETKYMASADGIEVWLVPVAFANSFVPVNVVIPTWAGSAQITSSKVQIDMPGRGHIAMSSN